MKHNDKFQKDLLITDAPHELKALMGESITCSDLLKSAPNHGPLLVRVTDPYECLFYFPIEQCKTWFVSNSCSYTAVFGVQNTESIFQLRKCKLYISPSLLCQLNSSPVSLLIVM